MSITPTLVGAETINSRRVNVFALPNRSDKYVEVQGAGKRRSYRTVRGAKLFKQGDYPLHPSLATVVEEQVYGGAVPFSMRSPEEQDVTSAALLKAMMGRLIDAKVPFALAEN